MKRLKIALIEPFLTGSHEKWARDFAKASSHNVTVIGLPGRFWKWRMHGGAISLAQKVKEQNQEYDVFLVSDFLDLALFKSLVVSDFAQAKFYIYFHENQITYPWSPDDEDPRLKRDRHYGFINYASALVADKVFLNSKFHQEVFLKSLPKFLKEFPDEHNLWTVKQIEQKSQVLNLAIELPDLDASVAKIPQSILWNHRWEYDKDPEAFFAILKSIKEKNIPFKLIILGEQTQKYPTIFDWAKEYFSKEILHFGYVDSKEAYWHWLQKAAILPVTSTQDFFGISIIEAIHGGAYPLLPNRLVYPEHIPKEFQAAHLYENDLEEKLIAALKEDSLPNRSEWVQKYAWSACINFYDGIFLY